MPYILSNTIFISLFLFAVTSFQGQNSKAAQKNNLNDFYYINVVVCKNQYLKLLDYFEGESLRGYKYSEQLTPEVMFLKLQNILYDRIDLYRQEYTLFKSKVNFVMEPEFINSVANDWIVKPPIGCEYRVLGQSNLLDKITIDQKLWLNLSESQKTGVFLNWAIAREVFQLTNTIPKSSIYIRTLNSTLISLEIQNWSLRAIIQILKATGLNSLRRQNILVDLNQQVTLSDQDTILEASPIARSTLKYDFYIKDTHTQADLRLKSDRVYFYKSGKIKSFRHHDKLVVNFNSDTILFSTPDNFSDAPIREEAFPRLYLYESGQIHRGVTVDASILNFAKNQLLLSQNQGRFEKSNNSLLVFSKSGDLHLATHVSGKIEFSNQTAKLMPGMSVTWFSPTQLKEFVTDDPIHINIQNKKIAWRGHMMFEENGRLTCGFVDQDVILNNFKNSQIYYKSGSQICFHPNGLAI